MGLSCDLQLGGAMLDMLINVATIPADPSNPEGKSLPAFYHLYEFHGQKKTGFFKVGCSLEAGR